QLWSSKRRAWDWRITCRALRGGASPSVPLANKPPCGEIAMCPRRPEDPDSDPLTDPRVALGSSWSAAMRSPVMRLMKGNSRRARRNIGGMNDNVQQETQRVDQDVPLATFDLLARVVARRIEPSPPFAYPSRFASSPTIRAVIMWCYKATTDLSPMLQWLVDDWQAP